MRPQRTTAFARFCDLLRSLIVSPSVWPSTTPSHSHLSPASSSVLLASYLHVFGIFSFWSFLSQGRDRDQSRHSFSLSQRDHPYLQRLPGPIADFSLSATRHPLAPGHVCSHPSFVLLFPLRSTFRSPATRALASTAPPGGPSSI